MCSGQNSSGVQITSRGSSNFIKEAGDIPSREVSKIIVLLCEGTCPQDKRIFLHAVGLGGSRSGKSRHYGNPRCYNFHWAFLLSLNHIP